MVFIKKEFVILKVNRSVKTYTHHLLSIIMLLLSTITSLSAQDGWSPLFNGKDFNDFEKKYGSVDSETPVHLALDAVSIFFDEVGVLVRRKLVDIGLVMDLFVVKLRWEKMKPLIEGARIRYGEPRMLNWFEYLYNESQRRRQKPQAQQ